MRTRRATVLASFLFPLLAACGDAAVPYVPPPTPVELSLPAVEAGEGFVNAAGSVTTDSANLSAGDNSLDVPFAAILCFDLTGVGPVQAAELTLTHTTVLGDPWALGPLLLDHIDGGGVLDSADQFGGTLTSEVHTLGPQAIYELDVTDQVAADVAAGRSVSTFRLRFDVATNADGANDFFRIASSETGTVEYRPTLVVSHIEP